MSPSITSYPGSKKTCGADTVTKSVVWFTISTLWPLEFTDE